MAGTYGAEQPGGRYRLSFTVGGLLVPQGRIIASMFVRDGHLDAVNVAHVQTAANPDSAGTAGTALPDTVEIGERITAVRRRAVDDNVLAIRTQAAAARVVTEVCKRVSTLTAPEIRHLADDDTMTDDCKALMWVSMCRYYALVGEFATEVLRDRYLMGMSTVTYEDYDRFILAKAMWHPELEELSPSTANKLRSNVFKAMYEAGLVERNSDTLLPSLLGGTLTGILGDRPESFLFFPVRGR